MREERSEPKDWFEVPSLGCSEVQELKGSLEELRISAIYEARSTLVLYMAEIHTIIKFWAMRMRIGVVVSIQIGPPLDTSSNSSAEQSPGDANVRPLPHYQQHRRKFFHVQMPLVTQSGFDNSFMI